MEELIQNRRNTNYSTSIDIVQAGNWKEISE